MKKLFIYSLTLILLIAGNTAQADRSASSWHTIAESGSGIGIYGATYSEGIIATYPRISFGSKMCD